MTQELVITACICIAIKLIKRISVLMKTELCCCEAIIF